MFMRWLVCVFIVTWLSPAFGQEGDAEREQYTADVYDQAVVRFNNNIKVFPTWEAFKTAIQARVPVDRLGTCYELTWDRLQPVKTTRARFQGLENDQWEKTSGGGWRQLKDDRTFTEYRVNEKAGVLLRREGVKPRFFFMHTLRICEFPL
jgi:hypothetical protein